MGTVTLGSRARSPLGFGVRPLGWKPSLLLSAGSPVDLGHEGCIGKLGGVTAQASMEFHKIGVVLIITYHIWF